MGDVSERLVRPEVDRRNSVLVPVNRPGKSGEIEGKGHFVRTSVDARRPGPKAVIPCGYRNKERIGGEAPRTWRDRVVANGVVALAIVFARVPIHVVVVNHSGHVALVDSDA